MSENDVIEGYLRETNVIQKARPLSLMRCVPFSLGELKVLDVYLSRINSHDSDHRTVTFSKAEYEELMGIEQTHNKTLKAYTRGMLGKVVEVPMPDDGWQLFVLFEDAELTKDEYGTPIVTLTCTEKAKRLFFDIEQLGYLRYELRNILALSSKYSYLLYLEIIRERYREEWSVSLPRLRDNIFDLKKNEYYKAFKYFKREVLDVAVEEINKKTDCCIEYDLIKRGRTVTDIKFRYTPREMDDQLTLTDLSPIPSAEDLEDDPEEKWIKVYGSERLANLAEVCNYEWGREDMERIECILRRINIAPDPNTNSVEWGRVFFLKEQYSVLNSEAAHKSATGKRIGNRYKYLVGMLERKAAGEE